jgi:leader peptidase (prepilin peptidase) / N-methyltransferase
LTVVFTIALASLLTLVAAIDFRRFVIPDLLNAGLLALGFVQAFFVARQDIFSIIVPILLAGGIGLAVRAAYFRLRGVHGLGLGDVKFMAAAGPWVGLAGLPWVLLVASFSGLLFAVLQHTMSGKLDVKTRLPFGPHLALGLFCTWILRLQDLL